MANLLLVDDDENLRRALKKALSKHGHAVTEAENGKRAQERLKDGSFDFVISDFQMPEMNGLDLLKWVRSVYDRSNRSTKPLPFILVTAFSHLLETQEAFDVGATDFLTKPFDYRDVLDGIKKNVPDDPSQVQDSGAQDEEYCKIPIRDFVSSQQLKINVYIRLSGTKFVRVAHKGDVIPVEYIDKFQNKGVEFLYIKKTDFSELVDFNLFLADKVQASNVAKEKKANFLRYSSEILLQQIYVNGVNRDSYRQSKDFVELSLSVVAQNGILVNLLDSLNNHSNWIYAHSLGVSVYSVLICKKLGWHSTINLFKVSLAGLVHDIGKKEIELAILQKSRHELSLVERTLIETHPTRGKEILESVKDMQGDVVQIVLQHHEDSLGQGYPHRFRRMKIHPLARVVATANIFCGLTVKNPLCDILDARAALDKMKGTYGERLDPEAFEALEQACLS